MKKTTIGMVLLCAILLGSCTKDAEMNEALPQNTETTMDAFKPMTFEQTRALVGEVLGSDVAERIEPTSRYVRVLFPNVDRLIEENRKEGLIYSSVPAPGIEITPVTVQEGQPEPQYTVLTGDAQLPDDVEYEVLAEFFAPDDPQSGLTTEQSAVVMQKIAEHRPMTRAATNWKPSGRIQYKDALTGEYYPMEGLRVVIFGYSSSLQMIQETVRTDASGNFTTTTTYAALPGTATIQWQDTKWSILSDNSSLASTGQVIDPNTMPRWNCMISPSVKSMSYNYATAFLAAKHMHENGYTLSNGTANSSMKICCFDESVPSNSDDRFYPDASNSNIMTVLIYCQDKTPQEVMQTVCREAGKAAQQMKIAAQNLDYSQFTRVITESWGEFTKYYFVDSYYKELDAANSLYVYDDLFSLFYPLPNELNRQAWNYNPTKAAYNQCRTPMFIDLIDNCDQSRMKGYTPSSTAKYPQDNVTLTRQMPISKFADWSVTCKSVDDVQDKCLGIISSDRDEILNVISLFTVYRELEQAL